MSRTSRAVPRHWAPGSEFHKRLEAGDYGFENRRWTKNPEKNRFLNGRDNKWSAHKNADDREEHDMLKHKRDRIVRKETKKELENNAED